jgi:hypothetical protein
MSNNNKPPWREDFRFAQKVGDRFIFFMDNMYVWLNFADSFHNAAQSTIHAYFKNNRIREANPIPAIGCLYRHSIELLLKTIVIVDKRMQSIEEKYLWDHDLSKLWNQSLQSIKNFYREEHFNQMDIEKMIKKLERWDKDSMHFRYPFVYETVENADSIEDISIYQLSATCERLYRRLYDCTLGMLEAYGSMDDVQQ